MRPHDLRCSYLTNPIGTEGEAPRLSWKLSADENKRGVKQTAYQVRVAKTAEALANGQADLWDSGKVDGGQTIGVRYEGASLGSGEWASWCVHVWDEAGAETVSDAAFWETGLLQRSDWTGQWIGGPLAGNPQTSVPAPFFAPRVFAG